MGGARDRLRAVLMTEKPGRPAAGAELAAAHARFGRAVMSIYLGTAAVAVVLLVTTLFTDLAHQQESARATLSLETQVRAHYLGWHLQLLADELTRLGLRSEVNPLDETLQPERDLLRLSHEKSAFFNVGVAILGPDGAVLWSEPRSFLAAGTPAGTRSLFEGIKQAHTIQVAPGQERQRASILYVASPIMRSGQFTGALLGAIDLVSGGTLEQKAQEAKDVLVALAARDGSVIYPPGPHDFAGDPEWHRVLRRSQAEPFVSESRLAGQRLVMASAPVRGTDFTLLSLASEQALYGPARSRLATRLALGLTLASLPLVILVVQLRRSLRTFRTAEEDAVRGERLRSLGEAVDLIAHEVKNSLNGIRVGLELILHGDRTGLAERHRQAVAGARREIERLSNFATELLSFSGGVVPRPVSMDLGEFVRKVAELSRVTAESRGILLHVAPPERAVRVTADPALIHVIVANLVGNALDFVGNGEAREPRVVVRVDANGVLARIRVADNGPGVSPAVKPRLFEPFVTGKPNGVGIGLALSRQIARAHGGDLVYEDAGPGAAFHLNIPLEQA